MVKKHNRKNKRLIYAIKQKSDNQTIGYVKTYTQAQNFLNSQYDRKRKSCPFFIEATNLETIFKSYIKLEEVIDSKELEIKAKE